MFETEWNSIVGGEPIVMYHGKVDVISPVMSEGRVGSY